MRIKLSQVHTLKLSLNKIFTSSSSLLVSFFNSEITILSVSIYCLVPLLISAFALFLYISIETTKDQDITQLATNIRKK